MAHRNEKFIRNNNPERIVGVNQEKLNQSIGAIKKERKKVDKTQGFYITVPSLFSPKEIATLAFRLKTRYQLNLRVHEIGLDGKTTLFLTHAPTKRI